MSKVMAAGIGLLLLVGAVIFAIAENAGKGSGGEDVGGKQWALPPLYLALLEANDIGWQPGDGVTGQALGFLKGLNNPEMRKKMKGLDGIDWRAVGLEGPGFFIPSGATPYFPLETREKNGPTATPPPTGRPTRTPTPIVVRPTGDTARLAPRIAPGGQTALEVTVRVTAPQADRSVTGYRTVVGDCQVAQPLGLACQPGAEVLAAVPVTTTVITVKPGLTVKNCTIGWRGAHVQPEGGLVEGYQTNFMVTVQGDMTMNPCSGVEGEWSAPFWTAAVEGDGLILQRVAARGDKYVYVLLKEQFVLPGAASLLPTPTTTPTPTATATKPVARTPTRTPTRR